MPTNKFIYLSFFVCFSFSTYGQGSIYGIIKDSNNNIIPFVNIFYLSKKDSAVIKYTKADKDGVFSFFNIDFNDVILRVTAVSFKEQFVNLKKSTQNFSDTITITLLPSYQDLNEVIVTSSKPIEIRGDTISYNVKSFSSGTEKVVEDMLKKIPGIEVGEDGLVRFNGKEVEKIMVEGDDFFEKGYHVLTRNMPNKVLDKVEVIKNFNSNSLLKRIEKSDNIALNLKLTDEAKASFFGELQVAASPIDIEWQSLRLNLFNFSKKTKYYSLTNTNTIGNEITGDLNSFVDNNDFKNSGSSNILMGKSLINGLEAVAIGINKSKFAFGRKSFQAFSIISNVTRKIKLRYTGFLFKQNQDFSKFSLQQYSIGTSQFTNNELFFQQKKTDIPFGSIKVNIDVTEKSNIELISKIGNHESESNNDISFNQYQIKDLLFNNSGFFQNKLIYTLLVSPKKVLIAKFDFIKEKINQEYNTNQVDYSFLNINNFIAAKTKQSAFLQTRTLESSIRYLIKHENNENTELFLEFKNTHDYLHSNLQQISIDTLLLNRFNNQNKLHYNTTDLLLGTSHERNFKKFDYRFFAKLRFLRNELFQDHRNDEQIKIFFQPQLIIGYTFNSIQRSSVSFSFNNSNMDVERMYRNLIMQDYRTFYSGFANFNQSLNKTILFNHFAGNYITRFLANIFVLFNTNENILTTNSIISPNYSIIKTDIGASSKLLSYSASINYFFKKLSLNFKGFTNGSISSFINSVNLQNNRFVTTSNFQIGFEIRSVFKKNLNFIAGSNWINNHVKLEDKNSVKSKIEFLDIQYRSNNRFNFSIKTDRFSFQFLNDFKSYYFTDIDFKFRFKKPTFNFNILINNFFNTDFYEVASITDISKNLTIVRLLPRVFNLGLTCSF
ncbi:MAG: hypothetical protein EAZ12_05095 [Sphingobacteriia bacterium]|nr:MAG: hypothetical protein EAZ12_05095 [Sphingobacteriia bacterium]